VFGFRRAGDAVLSDGAPKKFGKCRLVKRLGHGATAVVFLARHEVLDVPVAVKVLRKKLSEARPEYSERFLREAKMAARLDHPNIVRVFDCGIEDGYHYMVMDYVDGPSCQSVLDRQDGPMDWREATSIIRQVAEGLAFAAETSVIHRDVKPSNIMIDSRGRARVCDLGLAKLTLKGAVGLTQELHTVGTPNYMSPEQISSSSDLDLRSDIYSLGATFYAMVCGRPPFIGETPMKVIAQHLTAPLLPPRECNPELSPALSSIVAKMMAKSADERYQDYESLCRDLSNLVEGRAVGAAGFSESRARLIDEAELREVLEDLNFSEALEIDVEEQQEDDLDRAAGDEEKAKSDSSTVYAFGAADMVAYTTGSDEDEEEEEEWSTTQVRRVRRRRPFSIAMTVLGILVLILLAMILGYHLSPQGPVDGDTPQPPGPARPGR
jgi:serine/threonine-protein kinase